MGEVWTGDAEETEAILARGEVTEIAEVVAGSNRVFQVRLEMDGKSLTAVYKPARGERPLWDFPPHTLYRREAATYVVDKALGWGLVPPTVARRDGPLGPGSMQEWVAEPPEDAAPDRLQLEEELRRLAALDVLVNNGDRKAAHLLLDPGLHLRGIDHGVTFSPEFKLRTVLADLGGERVPAAAMADLTSLLGDRRRLGALEAGLLRLLDQEEVAAFRRRALELRRSGRYPLLDPFWGRPFGR
ncbi:MAG: protein kinase family protein [Candidatus Dormibacteria bacterium]